MTKEPYYGGMKLTILILAALIISAVPVFCPDPDAASSEEIEIAVLLPLSDGSQDYGIEYRRGIELAADELSRFSHHKYSVVFYDTEGNASTAAVRFKEICDRGGFAAVIGPATSTEVLAVAPLADRNRMIVISPSATATELSEYAFVYRTVPTDTYLGSGIADIVSENFAGGNVAVLYNENAYGKGLKEAVEHETAHQGKGCRIIPIRAENAEKAVSALSAADADCAIIITESPTQFETIMAQMEKAGIETVVITTDNSISVAPDGLTQYSDGVIAFMPTRKITGQGYREAYRKKFGEDLTVEDSIYGYDTMMVLGEVINTGGSDPGKIRNGLDSIRYIGRSGTIVFNDENSRYPAYDVVVVENGKWVTKKWGEIVSFNAG